MSTQHTIHCIEPQSRPARAALTVGEGESFCVFLLPDMESGLRATVLRPLGALAPVGALLILEVTVQDPSRDAAFRVQRVNPMVPIELLRPDHRSRLTGGVEIRSGARLDALLPDRRTLSFSLINTTQVARGAGSAVGGGGTRARLAPSALTAAVWLVPSVIQLIREPLDELIPQVRGWLAKSGLSPAMVVSVIIAGTTLIGSVMVAIDQHAAAEEAIAEAQAAKEQLAAVSAGQEAALGAEAACMAQRLELAQRLADQEALQLVKVEAALMSGQAKTVAVEAAGPRVRGEALEAIEAEQAGRIRSAVMARMGTVPPLEQAPRCLAEQSALGDDLPSYMLLYFPQPDLVCPSGFAAEKGGVRAVGSFGLSDRAAAAYAAVDPRGGDAGVEDVRLVDRLAALTLANGLRTVRSAILTADTGRRPPVAASELHLWTLALWDALNRMPSPAEGVQDQPFHVCVSELLTAHAQVGTHPPGQPVLADLVAVASGEVELVAVPTAGCPWPEDAMQHGARAALSAVAARAVVGGE